MRDAPHDLPRPLLIGWKEYLDLPELGVFGLKAKIDTGARTSTLHVESVKVLERLDEGGELAELALGLDPAGAARHLGPWVRVVDRVWVTDSSGNPEQRPLIETLLVLGPVRKRILLTLTDRSTMLFRMILGRTALAGDFRVDVARKYVLRRWHADRKIARGAERRRGRSERAERKHRRRSAEAPSSEPPPRIPPPEEEPE